jgi:hypothetical protein
MYNIDEFNNVVNKNSSIPIKNSYIDLNILKKQLEDFAYQKYSKRFNFTLKDIYEILNISYMFETEIYEIDIIKNKVNVISFKEYQNRLLNINLYEEMLLSKEIANKQTNFINLQLIYDNLLCKVNHYFPIKNYKNPLLTKIINFYERKNFLSNQKDKFIYLNNKEKLIYFFNNQSSFSELEQKKFLSIFNIQRFSMNYLHYNHLISYYNLLYGNDIFLNKVLYKHLDFQ